MVYQKKYTRLNYEKDIPQRLHLFSVSIMQQIRPRGKKQMAKQTPRAVKLSSSIPVWHAGQFPRM